MAIDEIAEDAPQSERLRPKQGTKANSIDDIIADSWPNPNPSTLDQKLQLDKKTSWWGVVKDVLKYAPLLAAQALLFGPVATLSTGITSLGFAIGGYFEARKNKKRFTWRRLRRELYSGNIFGWFDYAVYKVPEYFGRFIPYLGGVGLLNKIAKTIFFDALIVPPAVAAYNAVEYVRDSIGWKNFFKGFFNLKIFGYIKETYKNALKGKVLKSSANIWKILPPFHFLQINYLPNVQLRMAQAAFINNPIFRYTLGKKKNTLFPSYTPAPAYAPAYR